MISQQQTILVNSSFIDTISYDVINPMTGPKKSSMKGSDDPPKQMCNNVMNEAKEGIFPQDTLSEHGLKILDRCYTPKKVKVISSDIATKSKYGIFPSLICCKFLIKHNFLSFLFTNNKNFKK